LKWKVLYFLRHGHSQSSDYELAVRQVLTPLSGEMFWDVGANTGYYTLMLAKNFDRVTAFEPNPSAVEILERKIAKSRLSNIRLLPIALSDSAGRAKLYLHTEVRDKTIGSSNSLIPTSNVEGNGASHQALPVAKRFVEVETNSVDNILGSDRVALMKIDVEGAEFLVLNGAKNALEEGRITTLMIELHDEGRKAELESLLGSRHYRTRWLDYVAGSAVSRVLATIDKSS
jgi:FkbM family methyltransferase